MDASAVAAGRVINRRRQFGTMLLSLRPIQWSSYHVLPLRRMIDPLNTRNAALECLIETDCGPIRFLSLHLAHVGVAERLNRSTTCFSSMTAPQRMAAHGAETTTSPRETGPTMSLNPRLRRPQSGLANLIASPAVPVSEDRWPDSPIIRARATPEASAMP